MRNKDLIKPVRTRGAIRSRGGELEGAIPSPVRTRGAIRTRGAATALKDVFLGPSPILKVERSLALDALIGELREQVGDLPLTMLVHGWGSEPAKEFVTILSPHLREEDALWLIPTKETQASIAPPEPRGVILDLSRDTDQRIYRNLVGDIVFFPALETAEATQVAEWQQRARAVVIDGQGPQGDAVLQAGCKVRLMTYRWLREAVLEEIS
jgi:hypothetical protein